MGSYAFTLKPEGEKSTKNAMKREIFGVFWGGHRGVGGREQEKIGIGEGREG